jgi:hypothetical protein
MATETEFEKWQMGQLYVPHAKAFLPLRHAHMIRKNWAQGKPWWLCSPVFTMSREDIAFVVTADLKEKL